MKGFLLLILCCLVLSAPSQILGDTVAVTDSSPRLRESIIEQNKFLRQLDEPVNMSVIEKEHRGKEFLFYSLSILILLFAMFKVFYSRYFNTIFRVFFNTSLRQSQLTDILLQAKLPSLIFNIFFILSTGMYAWFIYDFYDPDESRNSWGMILLCIAIIGVIYAGKYFGLKLIGWLSGMQEAADTYIFLIFLINKITGIVLIPFLVLLAFSKPTWQAPVMVSSFLILCALFLLRYFRSYSLLRQKVSVNRFHFLLYIIALEIMPLMIIYRAASNSL